MTTTKPFYEMPLLTIDTETTGIDAFNDRTVTASLVFDVPGETPVVKSWLIDPGVEIPKGAADVHGITTEHAQLFGINPETAFAEIAVEIAKWVEQGLPVVAFNAAFDLTLINAEVDRFNIDFNKEYGFVIDPYVLDKWQDKWRKGKRTLEVMAPHYGVDLSNAHSSDADATATGEVARAIGRKFKLDMPIAELHQKQAEQRRIQSRDLEAYLRKTNPSVSIDGGWPIQTKG